MGAALHLAEVHQAPPGPKRKRKDGGSGGGSEFYEYAQQIYSDGRADSDTRALLLAFAYAVVTVPGDGPTQWRLIKEALGQGHARPRLAELMRKDTPRYVSPMHTPASLNNLRGVCSAPRLRPFRSRPWPGANAQDIADQAKRDEADIRNTRMICGAQTTDYVIEKLPDTGWHKLHYRCAAHRDGLERIRAQVAGFNKVAPEPIPNAGGLLPSYFEADWVEAYRHYRGADWEPPVYGVCADDWPIPGREPVAPRARLRLAALDGELLGGGV